MGKGTSQTQPLGSPHEVGRRIREVRDFDMTQAEFAERIGISQELSLHDGTRHGGDWGGDPASDRSGVCEEC
jgi:hypothetical protein